MTLRATLCRLIAARKQSHHHHHHQWRRHQAQAAACHQRWVQGRCGRHQAPLSSSQRPLPVALLTATSWGQLLGRVRQWFRSRGTESQPRRE
jgi:hypothetical protein